MLRPRESGDGSFSTGRCRFCRWTTLSCREGAEAHGFATQGKPRASAASSPSLNAESVLSKRFSRNISWVRELARGRCSPVRRDSLRRRHLMCNTLGNGEEVALHGGFLRGRTRITETGNETTTDGLPVDLTRLSGVGRWSAVCSWCFAGALTPPSGRELPRWEKDGLLHRRARARKEVPSRRHDRERPYASCG